MKIQHQSNHLIIFESELFRTTATLIIGKDYLLLIDPNWLPREIEFIYRKVEEIAINRKKYLLFTHSDYDHIIGYGKFKSFKTIASENLVLNKKKESILSQINDFDDQYYISRNYEIEYPKIDKAIDGDGIKIQLGLNEYIVYQAVGHNSDGIITFNKSKGILVVGDYLSNIEFPYIYESVEKYKAVLNKLQQIIEQYKIEILVTGHGDYTNDKKEMQKRINDSWDYIQQLESTVINANAFNEKALFEKYRFPKIMGEFHKGNIKLLKKEMAKKPIK